jgi:hypothetical protein
VLCGAGQLLHDRIVAEFRAWSSLDGALGPGGDARAQAFYRRNGWALDSRRDTNGIGGALVPIVKYVRSL